MLFENFPPFFFAIGSYCAHSQLSKMQVLNATELAMFIGLEYKHELELVQYKVVPLLSRLQKLVQ